MKTKLMSDEQLIEGLRAGQLYKACVVEQLYERYYAKVLSKCIFMLKDKELAQDEAQNIFIKVMNKLSFFNVQSRFSTWLYAVTHNHCIDAIRKQGRSPMLLEVDEYVLNHKPADNQVSIEREEEINRLEYVLEMIPSNDKELLSLKYLKGHKIKDISALLNKSEGAIKMALSRAKSRVKQHWCTDWNAMTA